MTFQAMFCLLYKHTNNNVFDDFPKISDHFPNEGSTKVSKHFPKIAEGNRRFQRMFRSYNSTSQHFLRDYVTIAMAAILRPCPHVYGYFRIRNFFVPDSKISPSTRSVFKSYSTVHTYPMVSGFTLVPKAPLH